MKMASRRTAKSSNESRSDERRATRRRWIIMGQGIYYVLLGVWPLLYFDSFASAVGLQMHPFQAQLFGAVLAVVGGALIESARREPPDTDPTLLAASVAAALALIDFVWLPRLRVISWFWVDLVVELAFAVTLIVHYPRQQAGRGQTMSRRRRL
jgi:hypothetical protein